MAPPHAELQIHAFPALNASFDFGRFGFAIKSAARKALHYTGAAVKPVDHPLEMGASAELSGTAQEPVSLPVRIRLAIVGTEQVSPLEAFPGD